MSENHGHSADHHAPAVLPEPKTPLWLTAVGAVLFLTVGLIWGLMPSSSDASGATPSAAPSADAGAPRH